MKNTLSEKAVCVISLSADCFLASVKLIVGKMANSSALFSDGLHSCADCAASLLTLLGTLPKDKAKKTRAEKITVTGICIVLVLTGVFTLLSSIKGIVDNKYFILPSSEALCVSVFAVIIKESLSLLSRYASEKNGSAILYAQSWHHQSDALSSVCGFIGTIGSLRGITMADKVASIFISILIIKSALEIRTKN